MKNSRQLLGRSMRANVLELDIIDNGIVLKASFDNCLRAVYLSFTIFLERVVHPLSALKYSEPAPCMYKPASPPCQSFEVSPLCTHPPLFISYQRKLGVPKTARDRIEKVYLTEWDPATDRTLILFQAHRASIEWQSERNTAKSTWKKVDANGAALVSHT